jgi:hypothetical protein
LIFPSLVSLAPEEVLVMRLDKNCEKFSSPARPSVLQEPESECPDRAVAAAAAADEAAAAAATTAQGALTRGLKISCVMTEQLQKHLNPHARYPLSVVAIDKRQAAL